MNDTIIIAMPQWFYWFLVACLMVNAIKTTLNLINQFLQWRVAKLREKNA